MDIKSFVRELLSSLATIGHAEKVTLKAEGPTVNGHVHINDELFLRFYFNEITGTIAFALIQKKQRVWGIDFDNRRGWHIHPQENPSLHIACEPLPIADIVAYLDEVLSDYFKQT